MLFSLIRGLCLRGKVLFLCKHNARNATLMRNLLIYKYIDEIVRSGSVRKAAEVLAITPSSLNRRIQSVEQELGTPLFERNAWGLRLNLAGEIALHTFRAHLAEIEALKVRIADIKGSRRGKISIVCSQAFLPHFLPLQISMFQKAYPFVQFSVTIADSHSAERMLMNYETDLALLFSPLSMNNLETITSVSQKIFAIMSDTHPLASYDSLKLSQCAQYPLALHNPSSSVRSMLDQFARKTRLELHPVLETDSYILLHNFVSVSRAIGFEIDIGHSDKLQQGIIKRPLKFPSTNRPFISLSQLRGRTLPVSAAKFAEQISSFFDESNEQSSI